MGRIYTRRGDNGMTGIRGGTRVPKDDLHIEANGCLDELNCKIGEARVFLPRESILQEMLCAVQKELMAVMSCVATPPVLREQDMRGVDPESDRWCEERIDEMNAACGGNLNFVLPGGDPAAACLQSARAIARRAERRLCTLNRTEPLPEIILKYANRLSDLLFAAAIYHIRTSGAEEEVWRRFRAK